MRMWNVDPKQMCRQHLLGEHLELHMFANAILKGRRMDGFISGGKLEPLSLESRHIALVEEMSSRGYQHSSPFPSQNEINNARNSILVVGVINPADSETELRSRCKHCFQLSSIIE